MIDRFAAETNQNLDITIKTTMHEKLEESQNRQDQDWENKLQNAMRTTLGKSREDMEASVGARLKEGLTDLHKRVVAD
jgi:hypothetical protein